MSTRVVTLKGTWSRTNTTRSEVNLYRKTMFERVWNNGGTFIAKCPTKGQPGDGLLEGTFEVTLPIGRGWGGQNDVRVAKKLFEALLLRTMCRPPKVRYESVSTTTSFDNEVVGILQ